MNEACEYLLGPHDFRNLCKMDVANGVTEFIRSIEHIDVQPFEKNRDNESKCSQETGNFVNLNKNVYKSNDFVV